MKHNKPSSKGFKSLREISDPRFGKCKLFKDPSTNNLYLCLSRLFPDRQEGIRKLKVVERRVTHANQHYIPISDFDLEKIEHFCSSTAILRLYIPYIEDDLAKELYDRVQESISMTNYEITILLHNMVSGLAHMEKLGITHGRLGPEYILKYKDRFVVMDNPIADNYTPISLANRKNIYLSPEAYMNAKNFKKKTYKVCKADVFSCGLIILEAALLRRPFDLFVSENGKFHIDQKLLNLMIKEVRLKYFDNNLLTEILEKMLEYDPDKRPSFRDILNNMPLIEDIEQFYEKEERVFQNQLGPRKERKSTSTTSGCRSMRLKIQGTLINEADKENQAEEKINRQRYLQKMKVNENPFMQRTITQESEILDWEAEELSKTQLYGDKFLTPSQPVLQPQHLVSQKPSLPPAIITRPSTSPHPRGPLGADFGRLRGKGPLGWRFGDN